MKKIEEKKFNLSELKGISVKTIEEHLKLYAGYVKHANIILEKIEEYSLDYDKNSYTIGELQRRFGFEYNGVKNHEIYFESLSKDPKDLPSDSKLKEAISTEFGSFEKWLESFKKMALTRGIGWAMLCYDKKENRLLNAWIDEQHLGLLQNCNTILALDMWEHSYYLDYTPAEKKKYVEAFFENLNWKEIEKNF
ncbi:MAG: hypothetical protein NDI62_00190 [Burkholderiales bacterium]|nr:hypothetical protein [Burkholderiales bacterium]